MFHWLSNRGLGAALRGHPALRTAATGVLLLAGACRDGSDPAAPGGQAGTPSFAQVSQDPYPTQAALAQAVPGFGGFFLDESGNPTVYLKDPAQRAAAEQALAGFFADRGFSASDLRVRQADYEYRQLAGWYSQAKPGLFGVSGLFLGDVDERINRVRVGVANAAAASAVQGVLTGLGIPTAAVVVEQRSPIRRLAGLQETVRPLQGGLQINFLDAAGASPVSFLCTLGFNAERFGARGFVTNSHCTNVEGGEETPTDYYQPLMDADEDGFVDPDAPFIATEVDDPHWSFQLNADCPPPFQCRYSDAARAEYVGSIPATEYALGRIARIAVMNVDATTDATELEIAGQWTIVRENPHALAGETVHKVGRTTGWTSGPVTATCVDVLALETNHIRLCQQFVGGISDGGDSGSPVFTPSAGRKKRAAHDVALVGILWGGSIDENAPPEFVFSPLEGVERELGDLTTF